jgi:beta-aspartyl-peptidase (threonine type)
MVTRADGGDGAHDGQGGASGADGASWSGGAGDVLRSSVGAHVGGCERAAAEGAKVLASGGSALDAAQRAVEVLESDPLFNAGTGACLDSDGHLSLDASIMDGHELRAGAVCVLRAFEHPIAIARRVMDATPHVLLAAEGAARFAIAQGFVAADEATMITDAARVRWEAARAKGTSEGWAGGTVGAVARDARGHVAAATSTGGMVNKLAGRVGDSPLVGAGTYADDEAGACSTTGHGEAMIRVCLAKTAVEAMRASADAAEGGVGAGSGSGTRVMGKTAAQTSRDAIALMQRRTAQTGGLIVVAPDGSLGLARTTRTMTWASVTDVGTASGS